MTSKAPLRALVLPWLALVLMGATGTCGSDTTTTPPPSTIDTAQDGEPALNEPLGMAQVSGDFGGHAYSTDSTLFVDPAALWLFNAKVEAWQQVFDVVNAVGVVGLSVPTAAPRLDTALWYGTSGVMARRVEPGADPARQLLTESVHEAIAHDGDADSGGALFTSDAAVHEVTFDEEAGDLVVRPAATRGDFPGLKGPFGSAFTKGADRPLAVVTRGPNPQLWHKERAEPGMKIADLQWPGSAIRSRGNVLAISHDTTNQLTTGAWSPSVGIRLAGTVEVGDGPMGIDVVTIANDPTKWIASTGFRDDTYTVTKVDEITGTVVSSDTRPLPAGCTQPVGALWVQIPQTRMLVACRGSATTMLLEVDL